MKRIGLRRVAIVLGCFALLTAIILLLPVAKVKATPSGVLSACVNPGNGMMRLVSSSSDCHANESFVSWNVTGPPGPQGPQGPQGPAGSSSGGPPFIWVCTPASMPHYGSTGSFQGLYVHNTSSTTANIAVNILDQSGTNLTGHTIPGSSGQTITTYPGDPGSSTETLAAAHTAFFQWINPVTAVENNIPGVDGHTDVSFAVRVTSDQPIVVGMQAQYGVFNPMTCGLSPK